MAHKIRAGVCAIFPYLQGATEAAEELDFADTEKTVQVQTQALEFNNGDEEAKLMDRCLNCGTRGHMSRNCHKPKVDNPEMEDVRRLFKEALARGRQKLKLEKRARERDHDSVPTRTQSPHSTGTHTKNQGEPQR
jgi:hypothetical protein